MKYNKNNKYGFTLVELLAVIVILAIILVIAVPKVMSVIEDAKKATLESTAKMIASQAEKQKVQNQVLGNDKAITCEGITNINDVDYASCDITFDENTAKVTITGSGKFEGLYVCNGTKTSATATEEECSGTGGTEALPGGEGGSGGESHNGSIPAGAYYGNLNTYEFYAEMPATVSEGDVYIYGDYVYQYQPSSGGWSVTLATAETGITNFIPDYPLTDRNQTSYGVILSSINGKSIVSIDWLFAGCTSLITAPAIPAGVTTIGRSTFDECTNLKNVTIPGSVTTIGVLAFNECVNLTQITIPESVTTIDEGAFSYCSGLTNIVIPNSVNSIGEFAFSNCTGLMSVRIPNSFRNIPKGLFFDCTGLTNIVFEGTMSQWFGKSFSDDWCAYVPATEVVCSDGNMSLN